MPPGSRALLFALVTLLVVLLIVDDLTQVENAQTAVHTELTPDPSSGTRLTPDPSSGTHLNSHQSRDTGNWTFNHTLANLIRKDILRFLDPVRDLSILRGAVSPGDTVHYVLDRHSSTHISDTLYRLLPSAPPLRRLHHHSCAIVGNSGILLDSRCGPEIDRHDFVIRCNLAPVEEFSADVGSRTDLVTMNPSVVQRAFGDLQTEEWRRRFTHRLKALGDGVLWVPAFMAKGGEERVEWALQLIQEQGLEVRTAVPSLRLLHAVRGYWLTKHVPIKRPSTGLFMYTLATRFCSQLHLYGFWPFPRDPRGAPVKYHYYDRLTYQYTSSSSPHTMPLEYRTLRTLHGQGALRLHTGPCEEPPTH
ncbi:hypothetical protein WMY93_023477 [Mugilogobius chulae]|uniref:Alpha-2,8-sialyltransferase 8B n=1 Tax=Mugilogobius chulae TaxID=88201 RepID=A0AAW0NBD7_9GOBI